MNANQLAQAVCSLEGKKDEQSIAQVKEILKCANTVVDGALYRASRHIPASAWIVEKKKTKGGSSRGK